MRAVTWHLLFLKTLNWGRFMVVYHSGEGHTIILGNKVIELEFRPRSGITLGFRFWEQFYGNFWPYSKFFDIGLADRFIACHQCFFNFNKKTRLVYGLTMWALILCIFFVRGTLFFLHQRMFLAVKSFLIWCFYGLNFGSVCFVALVLP